MKNWCLALTLIPAVASATDGCVMQDRTVSTQQYVIKERSDIKRNIVTMPSGQRRCIVDFRVRVGADWHQATGEYDWDGARPSGEACAAAVALAERDVQSRLAKKSVVSEQVMVCRDDPDSAMLRRTNPGSVGTVDQYRPHPNYPTAFYHNGTQCRWFLETGYNRGNIEQYQGVICRLDDGKWVVVDKF